MAETPTPQQITRSRRRHIAFVFMLLVTFSVFSFSVVSVTVWDIPIIPSTKAEEKFPPQNKHQPESTDQRLLENLVNRLTKELDEARNELILLRREKSELWSSYNALVQAKNEAEALNSKLKTEIEQQHAQLEKYKSEKESLLKAVAKTDGDLTLSKQESAKQLNEAQQKINLLRSNLVQSEEQMKAVNAKLETNTSNLQQTQAELESMKHELEKLLATSISAANTSDEITGAIYMEALRNECEKKYEFAIKNVTYVVEIITSHNGQSKWVSAGQFMNSFEPKQYPCIGRTRQANETSGKWLHFKIEEKLIKFAPGVSMEMLKARNNVIKSRYAFKLKDTEYDVEIIREKDKIHQWVSAGRFQNFYEPTSTEFCRAKKAGSPPTEWEYFSIEK